MSWMELENGKVRVLCYCYTALKTHDMNPEGWATNATLWIVHGFKPLTVVPIKVITPEELPQIEDRYYPAKSYGSGTDFGSRWFEFDKEYFYNFLEKHSIDAFHKEKREKERQNNLDVKV